MAAFLLQTDTLNNSLRLEKYSRTLELYPRTPDPKSRALDQVPHTLETRSRSLENIQGAPEHQSHQTPVTIMFPTSITASVSPYPRYMVSASNMSSRELELWCRLTCVPGQWPVLTILSADMTREPEQRYSDTTHRHTLATRYHHHTFTGDSAAKT